MKKIYFTSGKVTDPSKLTITSGKYLNEKVVVDGVAGVMFYNSLKDYTAFIPDNPKKVVVSKGVK